MKFLMIVFLLCLVGCVSEPVTTEQPCKFIVDERTEEYVEVCK